jgi:hypothetical protein
MASRIAIRLFNTISLMRLRFTMRMAAYRCQEEHLPLVAGQQVL